METVTHHEPLVDVVIPVYNGAQTVESAVRSICNQSVKNIKIIIVDDGSTDDTPSILRRLALEDNRIKVITTPNNGIVDALNIGMAATTADLIARFDADDIAYENRLAVQRSYLERHPDCAAVGCNVHFIDSQGRRSGGSSNFKFHAPYDPFYAPPWEPYLLHPFLLVRRKALERALPYRHVFHAEDADLYWRLRDAGALISLKEVLGEYRVHAASVSSVSALNGRVSAVNSTLAALSDRRRREGRTDLSFLRSTLAEYKQANTFDGILAIASRELDESEKAFLSIAASAKLLELESYRPYRLDAADLHTIREIIYRHHGMLKRTNRLRLLFRQVVFPKGLRPSGLRSLPELMTLMPWKLLPGATVEMVAHFTSKFWRRVVPASRS